MKRKTVPITTQVTKTMAENLARRAKAKGSSVEQEVVAVLKDRGLGKRLVSVDAVARRIRKLGFTTPDESVAWIREDRDSG